MATLNEAPEQLRNWIKELDGQIGMLGEQRDMLASTLAILDGSAFEPEPVEPPKNPGGRPRAQLAPDEVLEARRASDRERKKNQRRGIKAPPTPGAGGTTKYDYAEVWALANDACLAGVGMASFVEEHMHVNPGMGSYLIKEARKRGYSIPERKRSASSNVTPLLPKADIETASHPATGPRAFTPDDTLKLLQGG